MEEKRTINIGKNSNVIATLLIMIFYLAYFLKMVSNSDSFNRILADIVLTGIGVGSLIAIALFKGMHKKTNVIIVSTFFFITAILSALYTGNYRTEDFLLILQYLGVGLLLYKSTLNYKIVTIFHLFYSGYFFLNIIIGTHPDNLFDGFSRNNVSVFMIICTILLYVSAYQTKNEIILFPAISTFLFSVWAIGRSGIITSLLLLTVILFVKQKISGFKSLFTYMFVILLFIWLYTNYYESFFQQAIERSTILGITDDSRGFIINSYLDELKSSLGNMFFGVSIAGNTAFSIFKNNLHNSYLRLYSYHGLMGLLLVVFQIIYVMLKYLKKKNYLFVGLFLVILLRISTDIAAFHGPFDPLIIFFMFNEIFGRKSQSNLQKYEKTRK